MADNVLYPVQMVAAYLPAYENKNRYLVIYGGRGSGKSMFAAQKIVIRSIQEPNHKILIVRKVRATHKDSTWALLKHVLDSMGVSYVENKSNLEMVTEEGGSFLFAGLDNPEKLKSMTGITGIWIEELGEVSEREFDEVDLLLRGRHHNYKQVISTLNPTSRQSWIYSRFVANDAKNSFVLKTTHEDNPFLDEAYSAKLNALAKIDPQLYQRYAEGDWVDFGNTIYSNFKVEDFCGIAFGEVIIGLDFGFTNPTAAVAIGIYDGEYYLFDEMYASQLLPEQIAGRLSTLFADWQLSTTTPVYADCAEADRIHDLARRGFNVIPAKKGKDSVYQGILEVKQKKLHIHPRCAAVCREIEGYAWRKARDGSALEEPVKHDDHAMDAMRYAITTHDTAGDARIRWL